MTDRAVLWDLDGTLVDSAEQHWEAWRELLEGLGVKPTRQEFGRTFGQRNDTILRAWLGDGLTPEQIDRYGDAKEARYREMVAREGLAPLPGAADWVRRLSELGWKQAVASSAPRENIRVVMDTIGFVDYFDAVVGAEDVRQGKPAPDVFLTAADRLNTMPARCIVVEDAPAGVESARRAGMPCIGIEPGGANADLPVSALTELSLDAFERLLERGHGGPGRR